MYSLDDRETKMEEICMVIGKEENQPKKTPLNLENLVLSLECKINSYSLWKDLQIIIKGKILEENEDNLNSKEVKELINTANTTIQIKEQVNMRK